MQFQAEAIIAMDSNGVHNGCSIDIIGTARAQQRPRTRWMPTVQRSVTYDPASAVKKHWMKISKEAVMEQTRTIPIFGDTTKIEMVIVCSITNESKDIDNLLKFIMDGLQSIIYRDDKMVYKATVEKVMVRTKEEEKTTIYLTSLN